MPCFAILPDCGLSSDIKVTSVKSEPVILRITIMQTGKGPSSLSWLTNQHSPKGLAGLGLGTCRHGVYTAEHSEFEQAGL